MATRLQFRRDTAAAWAAANPVLMAGEPGRDSTNRLFKIGDGVTPWADLPYSLSRVLAVKTAPTTVVNTAVETALATLTIPGGLCAAGDLLRATLAGSYLNNSGAGSTLLWRLKLGGTTLLPSAASSIAASGQRRRWVLDITIVVQAVAAQLVAAVTQASSASASTWGTESGAFPGVVGHAAATENLAVAQDLVLTVEHQTAAATIDAIAELGVLTLTKG